jgi:tetratricopeptide (TPR) repeat protein
MPPGNGVRPRMKDEPRVPIRHQLEHPVPTVIHHPEEDLPLLARWLRRAMENQTRFWSLLFGLVAVVVLLAVLSNGLSLGRATSDEAWTKLELADTPAKRVEVAEDYPNTLASRWALLQAATEFYNRGFNDLPRNIDAAGPSFKRAAELFERVERESPADGPQARAAAFGGARTMEARNKLDKAIDEYKRVVKTWPDTEEARQAKLFAAELQKPEAAEFYRELYAYKVPEFTLPPEGEMKLPPGHPLLNGLPPSLLPPPPPRGGASKAADAALPDLPDDVFAPTKPGTAKPGTAKPEK